MRFGKPTRKDKVTNGKTRPSKEGKKMGNEMEELKETVSEIKNILSKPAKQPDMKPNQQESNLTTSD